MAHQAAKAMGVEDLRIAEYPGAVGVHQQEVIQDNVEKVLFERGDGQLGRSFHGCCDAFDGFCDARPLRL